MTRTRALVLGFALLGAALLTAVVLREVEIVREEADLGFRGAARVNPYLAAELLLDELGVPTESRFGLGPLPPSDHVVLVLAEDAASRRPFAERLTGWVTAGGHLVVAASPPPCLANAADGDGAEGGAPDGASSESPGGDGGCPRSEEPDPLLALTGLLVIPAPPKGGPNEGGGDEPAPEPSVSEEVEAGTVEVEAPDSGESLRARLGSGRVLARPPTIDDETGARWLEPEPVGMVTRVRAGEGTVTVVVDPSFARNDAIGEHDHARLLVALVSEGELPSGAVIVVRGESSSLAVLLARHGWPVLAALLALLAAWVWLASRRLGPRVAEPEPRRRSLLEHVEAAGAFLWRHGHHWDLLESTRQAVRERLAARLPGSVVLEGGDLAEAVSHETGMRASRVHEAFYGGGPRDRKRFTEAMRELQQLWRST